MLIIQNAPSVASGKRRNISVTSAYDKSPCPCGAVIPLSADDDAAFGSDKDGYGRDAKYSYTLQY